MMAKRWGVALALLLTLAALSSAAWADETAETPWPDDADFLAEAVGQYGAEASALEIEHKALTTLADGRQVFWAKVWDSLAERALDVTLDEAWQPLGAAEASLTAQQVYASRYGKLDPSLHEALQPLAADEWVEVAIGLSSPPELGPERVEADAAPLFSAEAVEAFRSEQTRVYQEQVLGAAQPFVAELTAQGREVRYVSADTPLVIAWLPKSEVLALSQHPGVTQVWPTQVMEEELDRVKRAVRAPTVWSAGVNGRGIRVGISEVGGLAQAANPYLNVAYNRSVGACGLSSHGTAVAGIVAALRATDTAYRGLAPRAQIFYEGACIGYWDRLATGWQRLRSRGVRIINASWGADNNRMLNYTDQEMDAYARNYGLLMVKSAGNRGPGVGCPYSDADVTNPGLGYNVLTVGNYDHRRTPTWTDDTMANTCSSYGDPLSRQGDRDKPEVVAPGTNIYSTRASTPWVGGVGSGTSYSAPVVAAEAALLMQAAPNLQGWPEPVRAIIMAAALNPVGQTYRGAGGQGPRLSEQAGAGGVDFPTALDIARRETGSWQAKTVYYTTFTQGVGDRYFAYRVFFKKQKTVRAALVWDTNPAATAYNATSQPSSDLDLRVYLGNRKLAYSSSYDNTYEILEFTTAEPGAYELRVYRHRWSEGGTTAAYRTYAGLAWYHY
ncbi:MAG: S8 family serine peptidase [Chloroflexi bacterium]|nr:S8 family serine peptidase [Chloroflexota bacterium]